MCGVGCAFSVGYGVVEVSKLSSWYAEMALSKMIKNYNVFVTLPKKIIF